jgi:hypothetical protein
MICKATPSFDFTTLFLAPPKPLQGGSFLTKIIVSPNDDPLYLQTPKCSTKSGIVNSTKKHIDLCFTKENVHLMEWINTLEERTQQMIYDKRKEWFISENITLDDIQSAFMSCMKHKSDGYTIRVSIPTKIEDESIVYDDHENQLTESSIKETSKIVGILDFVGIKFTQKTFQLVIHMKQIMLLTNTPFSKCMIKKEDIIEIDTTLI